MDWGGGEAINLANRKNAFLWKKYMTKHATKLSIIFLTFWFCLILFSGRGISHGSPSYVSSQASPMNFPYSWADAYPTARACITMTKKDT